MKKVLITLLAVASLAVVAGAKPRTVELENPVMRVYLPDEAEATGRAVVALPGGGYTHLATGHEGHEWAPWFNKQGIAYAVVSYRLPTQPGVSREMTIADAMAAVKVMRDSAEAWHINPCDVGIMGSSAGGHLASTVATHAEGASKPDFQILFYPVITMDKSYTHMGSHDNLLGKEADEELETLYSNEKQVDATTGPAWIAFSDDDNVVPPLNGINYYAALHRAGVPSVIHIYPTGGHGWGVREGFKYKAEMQADLKAWLESLKPACRCCKEKK